MKKFLSKFWSFLKRFFYYFAFFFCLYLIVGSVPSFLSNNEGNVGFLVMFALSSFGLGMLIGKSSGNPDDNK